MAAGSYRSRRLRCLFASQLIHTNDTKFLHRHGKYITSEHVAPLHSLHCWTKRRDMPQSKPLWMLLKIRNQQRKTSDSIDNADKLNVKVPGLFYKLQYWMRSGWYVVVRRTAITGQRTFRDDQQPSAFNFFFFLVTMHITVTFSPQNFAFVVF